MRYFLRTEAACLVTLPNVETDPQRYVEMGGVLTLDTADPNEAKIARDLAQHTHGWAEVDEHGDPCEPPPDEEPEEPDDDEEPGDDGDPPVDSPTT